MAALGRAFVLSSHSGISPVGTRNKWLLTTSVVVRLVWVPAWSRFELRDTQPRELCGKHVLSPTAASAEAVGVCCDNHGNMIELAQLYKPRLTYLHPSLSG